MGTGTGYKSFSLITIKLAHMARQPRIQYSGAFYHITVRGNEKRVIFTDDQDRNVFLKILKDVISRHNLLCYAYCLMDNHFHLLIETPDGNIARAMHNLNGSYAQYFNKTHERVGHLFQNRYYTSLLEKEAHLIELARYIVLNPVRAGLVKNPGDWRWSSYNTTVNPQVAPDWLQAKWILDLFSHKIQEAISAYRQFVRDGMTPVV